LAEARPLSSRVVGSLRGVARRLGMRNPLARATPTNWQIPPATAADIEYQVQYAVSNGEDRLQRLQHLGIEIAGARILEIGPGIAFGGMAYLRAAGADVTVTDRWLAKWSDTFHGPVYAAIADRLEGQTGFDVAPLRRMITGGGYIEGTIRCVTDAAEDLGSLADGAFDALISNAVLEHIERPAIAFGELFRVTRSGGVGLHQVDFRDHRDFSLPLEHLLIDPANFAAMNRRVHSEFGSQLRQPDYAELLQAAGFRIERYESNDTASAAYIDTVMQRLDKQRRRRPPNWTRDVLSDLGGLFWLRKP
jgi:SAM-dependent methyltransferase